MVTVMDVWTLPHWLLPLADVAPTLSVGEVEPSEVVSAVPVLTSGLRRRS